MRSRKLLLVLSILIMAALACATLGGGDSGNQAASEGSQATESSGDENLQPDSGVEPTAASGDSTGSEENQGEGTSEGEPESSFSPGSSLDLDDPALYEQFSGLESYRTTLLNTFDGVDADDAPVTGTVSMVGAARSEPYATTLAFTSEGRAMLSSGEVYTFTRILDTQYIASSGMPCISGMPGMQENPFEILLDNGGLLTGLADFIETEAVNGVETNAFKITEQNINTADTDGSLIQNISKGRLNIANDGGYVVRLILQGSGTNEMLSMDPDLEGDVYYELNYFDFNLPVDIQVPGGCQVDDSEAGSYPLPEDATAINQMGDFMTFQTGLSVEETAAFYQEEMQAIGCSAGQELGSEDGLILSFENCPDGGAQVVLAPEGDQTYVTILKMP